MKQLLIGIIILMLFTACDNSRKNIMYLKDGKVASLRINNYPLNVGDTIVVKRFHNGTTYLTTYSFYGLYINALPEDMTINRTTFGEDTVHIYREITFHSAIIKN